MDRIANRTDVQKFRDELRNHYRAGLVVVEERNKVMLGVGATAIRWKAKLDHGQFMRAYKAEGYTESGIQRAISVFRAWEYIPEDVKKLDNVTELYKVAAKVNKENRRTDKALEEVTALKVETNSLREQVATLEERKTALDSRMGPAYERAVAVLGKEEVDRNLKRLEELQGQIRESEAIRLADVKALAACQNEAGNWRRKTKELLRQRDDLKAHMADA